LTNQNDQQLIFSHFPSPTVVIWLVAKQRGPDLP
jgi:hypothetical protein